MVESDSVFKLNITDGYKEQGEAVKGEEEDSWAKSRI